MSTPRSRGGSILVLAALILAGADPAGGSPGGDEPGGIWYAPKEADFRATYDLDVANRKAQTWEQYWGWIKVFYEGNFLASGWTKHMAQEVAAVTSTPAHAEIVARLNRVGRRVAGEWAKEDAVRRINSTDLKRWNTAIGVAKAAEDGSGERLKAAIRTVEDEVAKRLGK